MSDIGKTPSGGSAPPSQTPHLRPGDEAPAGTPGTAENTCRKCGGSGAFEDRPCPDCEGTGLVTTGIGGA